MLRRYHVTIALVLLLAGCSSSPKPASNVNPPPVEYAR